MRRVVERWDDTRLGEWQALMAQTAQSQEEMARQDSLRYL